MQGYTQCCRAGLSQQTGVVIAALVLSLTVQGYWNDHICLDRIRHISLCQQVAQRLCQARISPVLQSMNVSAQWLLKYAHCTQATQMQSMIVASFTCTHGRERRTAKLAKRNWQRLNLSDTGWAQNIATEFTSSALRRKEHIQEML
jgi:hypothetical protein